MYVAGPGPSERRACTDYLVWLVRKAVEKGVASIEADGDADGSGPPAARGSAAKRSAKFDRDRPGTDELVSHDVKLKSKLPEL